MTMLSPDFAQNPRSHDDPAALITDAITEVLRAHARRLIAAALETEVASVVAELKAEGASVVRNGYLPERSVTTAIGDVKVKVPRIRSKDGGSVNFTSTLVPKYLRRSKSISAWAAYAYLKGVSEADMAGVLEVVLGEGAKKLTPSVVSSLKKEWTAGLDAWGRRDLPGTRFTYIYADGIYQQIRGDNPKLCALVIVGVDESGKKHLVALEDGVRESAQSWKEVLLDLRSRGMKAPALAVGDGALGFWAALDSIGPHVGGLGQRGEGRLLLFEHELGESSRAGAHLGVDLPVVGIDGFFEGSGAFVPGHQVGLARAEVLLCHTYGSFDASLRSRIVGNACPQGESVRGRELDHGDVDHGDVCDVSRCGGLGVIGEQVHMRMPEVPASKRSTRPTPAKHVPIQRVGMSLLTTGTGIRFTAVTPIGIATGRAMQIT